MKAILTSTVVAALISSIIGFLQNRKSENLQYITSERAKWRERIRDIFDDISSAQNIMDLKGSLAQLKTRINPYGKYVDNYNKDSHIWMVIDNLEKSDSNCKFRSNKIMLLDYLSLLLKRDWEISKNEIKGNIHRSFIMILLHVTVIAFLLVAFFLWKVAMSLVFWIIIVLIFSSFFLTPRLVAKKAKIDVFKQIMKFNIKFGIRIVVYAILMFPLMYKITLNVDIENRIIGAIIILILNAAVIALDYESTRNQYIDEILYFQAIESAKDGK